MEYEPSPPLQITSCYLVVKILIFFYFIFSSQFQIAPIEPPLLQSGRPLLAITQIVLLAPTGTCKLQCSLLSQFVDELSPALRDLP